MKNLKLFITMLLLSIFCISFANIDNESGFTLSSKSKKSNPLIDKPAKAVEQWITVGDGSGPYGNYNTPVDFYAGTSLTQCIYHAGQINSDGCLIEEISYTYTTMADQKYPNPVTEHFKIWMSNTERDVFEVVPDVYDWLPLSDFVLVYDGMATLMPGKNQSLKFKLDEPFVYSGGNLCIMTEWVLGGNKYENHFKFVSTVYGDNDVRARCYWSDDTPFDFGTLSSDDNSKGSNIWTTSTMSDVKLGVKTSGGGSITGIITDAVGESIEGAKVQIEGTSMVKYTGAGGGYAFNFLEVGEYNLKVIAFGYITQTKEFDVTGATNGNMEMVVLPKHKVSGKIVNGDGKPIADVAIKVDGYDKYKATTATDGTFELPAVWRADGYTMELRKTGFIVKNVDVDVKEGNVALGDIKLYDILRVPAHIVASRTDTEAKVEWSSPVDEVEYFRIDDGVAALQLGANSGNPLAIFGVVYTEPTQLYNMSWYLRREKGVDPMTGEEYLGALVEKVNLFVMEIDEDEKPTREVLYFKEGVPTVMDDWSSFTFPEVLDLPNGFMIAVSCDRYMLQIGLDSRENTEWPYVSNRNFVTLDYKSEPYMTLEELANMDGNPNFMRNMMIRGEGLNPETGRMLNGEAPLTRSLNSYQVFRLQKDKEKTPADWVTLTLDTKNKEYIDSQWASIPQGEYRYAIKAIYSENKISEAAFSNVVTKNMTSNITINVKTNTTVNEADGAIVTLTNKNNNPDYVYTATVLLGKVSFTDVWKGEYTINIEQEGFTSINEAVSFATEATYTKEYTLVEKTVKPFNLKIVDGATESDKTFYWNLTDSFEDDFERHDDFTPNSAGPFGWSYIDADKEATVVITNFDFPGMGDPSAFVLFNPSGATPPIDVELNPELKPHSGEKYLSCWGVKAEGIANDDYLISPELYFETDFTFKFFARGFYYEGVPVDKFMVGYSTTGKAATDFKWITTTPLNAEAEWTEYKYDISKDVKYVTIRCVSEATWVFLIDDVFIGQEEQTTRSLSEYEVFLVGESVGKTSSRMFEFNGLADGNYTVGVKAIYSSVPTAISSIDFNVGGEGVDEIEQLSLSVYPNPVKDILHLNDIYSMVEIYDATGRIVMKLQDANSVSTTSLNDGIYVLRAYQGDRTGVSKFIIQK